MKLDHFDHARVPAAGVLLANLGTPDAPTPAALRRYLGEFLSDRRVIEIPRALWWPILHGVILRLRPKQSAAKYATIWGEDGSPLLAISRRQAEALQTRLREAYPGPISVALGMRYGNPSIAAALEELRQAGVRRLLVLPLYPQYSAATSASTFDALAAVLRRWRWLPELRVVNHYHDFPAYIDAVADGIRDAWQQRQPGERLLFSFHGLPERNLLLGDPYHCECHKTARLVAQRLQLDVQRWGVAFQSRFGRAEWLKPYTSDTLSEWAKSGVKSVDVVCPGFAADCLETLEEIALENRDVFLQAGGSDYYYIPALNDSRRHIDALAGLVAAHTAAWPEFESGDDQDRRARYLDSQRRAQALGALA